MDQAITDRIQAFGVGGIAGALQISPQAVYKWLSKGRIPKDQVLNVARATGFQITPHELCPSIYPNPTDGLPTESMASAPTST